MSRGAAFDYATAPLDDAVFRRAMADTLSGPANATELVTTGSSGSGSGSGSSGGGGGGGIVTLQAGGRRLSAASTAAAGASAQV